MRLQTKTSTYSLSSRDLAVMGQLKIGINELTDLSLKQPGLPPLWSRIPYLMLLLDPGTETRFFWKEYRLFDALLKTRDHHYGHSRIPKANGELRDLRVPDWILRQHQNFILKNILYKIPVSEHACAYHKHRGLTDLAQPHIGHQTLIHLDIKDFFSSITEQMVFEALVRETGYPQSVAGFLSRLCCYKHYLPQGACTSPAISNICFKQCDDQIAALAKQNNLSYTRYSDDIYLSGNNVDPQRIIHEVEDLVSFYGFKVNSRKTRILGKHQAQKVTSIVVNEKMQVPREYRRKLRQEIYYLTRFEENAHGAQASDDYQRYLNQLLGKVSYVLYVDPTNKEFKKARRFLEERIYPRYFYRFPF